MLVEQTNMRIPQKVDTRIQQRIYKSQGGDMKEYKYYVSFIRVK